MKYKKIDCSCYNVHLLKTDKFKTITIRVCFKNEIVKENITLKNFLINYLTYSTDKYRTKRDLVLKMEDLYAAVLYTKNYRSGRFNMNNFYLSFLNPKYTEDDMLEDSIKFLSDVLFNPNFNDDKSYKESYDYLFDSYKKYLEGIKDNPGSYSMIRMLEEIDKNKPYGYREFGYIEDLKTVTKDNLIKEYNNLLSNSLIDIYIIGDINDDIVYLINKYFIFNTTITKEINPIIEHDIINKKIKFVKEVENNNQSKLSIGCKIDKLSEFERNYVLSIYNMILGGTSESKFFQVIREKNSLAYYCSSSVNKLDNLLLIAAGISKDNYDEVVELIKKLMKEIEDGKFSDEDIKVAKQNYISRVKEAEDSEDALMEVYVAKDLLNLGNFSERKKEVMKVTKKDIIELSKKISIDTIFLLEGVVES